MDNNVTKYTISRYDLNKKFISKGELTIIDEGTNTTLNYKDDKIDVTESEMYHPLMALEKLRKKLETKHKSILACNGCRIDTAYRPTGGFMTYVIRTGKKATKQVDIFEPTNDIDKLCTVQEHEIAYDIWWNSLDA